LDFRGPIMGSLKSPCTTSYRSSIETIALNCLVFEKIAFLYFGDRQTNKQIDRQTNRCRQTNRWTTSMHEGALEVASGGLINVPTKIKKKTFINAFVAKFFCKRL